MMFNSLQRTLLSLTKSKTRNSPNYELVTLRSRFISNKIRTHVGGEFTSVKEFTQSNFYKRILQGGIYTINLALVDAAYSGDWSRIGVISTDTELYLQSICLSILGLNVLSSLGTAILNITRNKPWLLPVFATFGIGVPNLIQQFYEDEKIPSMKLTPLTMFAAALGAIVIGQAISKSIHFGSI